MSHGLKLLLIAAGAIITCIVVVVGFGLTQSGKNDTVLAKEQYADNLEEYEDVKLMSYDQVILSGADVISCIHEHEDLLLSGSYDFTIEVITAQNIIDAGAGTVSGVSYGAVDGDYSTLIAQNTSIDHSLQSDYINPKGKFIGSIGRNANGVIDKITFTQQ